MVPSSTLSEIAPSPARTDSYVALYDRIWAHPFEHKDQARDIVRRLAMEQGWSMAQSRQAVEEYRRFCFLAVAARHPVTPSVEVDAVWHLHLLHTRDYWEVFCPKVLGRPFHHGPTLGGAKEESRFYDQYAQTIESYQHFFGPPPEAWWPHPSKRFLPARLWRWVFLPEVWVIPKPRALLQRLLRRVGFHRSMS